MFDWGRTRKILFCLLIAALIFESGVKFERYRQEKLDRSQLSVKSEVKKNQPSPSEIDSAVNSPEYVYVHVVGAVVKPGVYRLKLPARVSDAVNLAVPSPKADLSLINLAEPVIDGQQISVPRQGEKASIGAGGAQATSAPRAAARTDGKININTATAGELDAGLPGIGPTLARRIVDYRKSNGLFTNEAQLQNVSGIGQKRYGQLRDKITVR